MSATRSAPPATQVQALRGFNRFYTQRIGVLEPWLEGELSLAEVRVLYELAHRDQPTASEIAAGLALDAGYLSRILKRFEARDWIARVPSPADARQSLLALTPAGRAAFEPLQRKSDADAAALLATVPEAHRLELIAAMQRMQALLAADTVEHTPRTIVLRDPRPGDFGWVVQAHGEVYAKEYGYSVEFEGLVAGIVARFVEKFEPERERCWIAEVDGERAGSVFVVRQAATVAKLRLLVVTPEARGLGLGQRLTDECIAFARAKGYRRVTLWTNGQLAAARGIYRSRGFVLKRSEPLEAYGRSLTSEIWDLDLRQPRGSR